MWGLLLAAITLGLFCLPLLPAIIEFRWPSDVAPLQIEQEHTGNIRFFADRFREVMASFADSEDNFVQSSSALSSVRSANMSPILVAEEIYKLPAQMPILGEIHARQSLATGVGSQVRAALVEHTLALARGSALLRWAHARHIRVGENCIALGRLSAQKAIILKEGSTFRRMNAPTIIFGKSSTVIADDWDQPKQPAITQRVLHNQDLRLVAGSLTEKNIIVRGNLHIGKGARIIGSIKSHGDMILEADVVVHGALICGGDLKIGSDCRIRGPVVAEISAEAAIGNAFGTAAQPTTVTAPRLRFAQGVVVHGTVWARHHGIVQG